MPPKSNDSSEPTPPINTQAEAVVTAEEEAAIRKEYDDDMRATHGEAWMEEHKAQLDNQWEQVKGLFL